MENYQISIEDIEKNKLFKNESTRYAYIDEFGSFGFDFSKEGTSKYFILSAVIVKSENLSELNDSISLLRKKYFSNSEMKSSNIGSNEKRRMLLITELLKLKFKLMVLIANKEEFYNSALTNYKNVFYKFLHQILYENLYAVYPKLKIYADELGNDEFMVEFKKYVNNHRPKYNLLNEYSFDFINSKNENIIQLSDIIVGSFARYINDKTSPNYLEILAGKIQHIEYFPNNNLPRKINKENQTSFDEKIYGLSYRLATEYLTKHKNSEDDEVRLRVGFLKILLLEVQHGNPFKYVTSNSILTSLNEYAEFRVSRDYLYRKIVAPLRDDRIIIASSNQGYKIPVSIEDVFTYLNQTNTIVSPMLHRIGLCRDLIRTKTDNELDILDSAQYLKFKKYFD